MAKFRDLTGERFGRWAVISHFDQDKWGHHRWLCRCDCGNEKVLYGTELTSGRTTSCGCYFLEWNSERHRKHGDCHKRLYRTWSSMRKRCRCETCDAFKRYGGRGITICKDWEEYSKFKQWAISNGYQDDLTIERIDVNGNYCPENCKWIPFKEQAKNRTTTVWYKGKNQAEWARELNVTASNLGMYKSHHKCSLEDAVKHFQKLL